jgi:predicted transcriptional regulator
VSRVTSVRLSDDLATRLDKLAASLDRPRAWLIEQAIARYLDEQSWQVEAISEALTEYRTGRASLRPHDSVMTRIEDKLRSTSDDADPLA